MVIERVRAARFSLATWSVFIRTANITTMMGERSSTGLQNFAGVDGAEGVR
jgi:hypothetical protein